MRTFDEGSSKARLLDTSVGNELHRHFVRGRVDIRWNVVAAEATNERRVWLVTVSDFEVVVDAVVVVFHLERVELKSDRVALLNGDLPQTVLVGFVVVGRCQRKRKCW